MDTSNSSNTPPPQDSAVLHWKNKYFENLEEQEKELAGQLNTINLLRRGLLSVSLAGDGLDQELDRKLAQLRKNLHNMERGANLNSMLQEIEDDLLRIDEGKNREAAGLKTLLATSITQLLETSQQYSSQSKRSLTQLQKKVRKSPEDARVLHRLLLEFVETLIPILNELRSDVNQQAPKGGLRQSLARFIFAKPEQEATPAANASGGDTREAYREQRPDHSHAEQADAPEILGKVGEFIIQILDGFTSHPVIGTVANDLKQAVLLVTDPAELEVALQKSLNLISLAQSSDHDQLTQYLKSISQSVEQLNAFVNKTRAHRQQQSKVDLGLDEGLRFNVDTIHNNLTAAADLAELKSSIQGQLDEMLTSMDDAKSIKQEADAAYSTQVDKLAAKMESMEEESRMLRETVTKQQEAMRLDSLTKLNNRNAYFEKVEQEYETWKATNDDLSLCIADIDHFRRVNNTYGHSAGDKALELIAREINTHIKKTDFLARYGGEEFIIILPATSAEEAKSTMQKIGEVISRCKFRCKGEEINITMSFGITQFVKNDSVDAAFQRAEDALYQAKNSGRNRSQVC